MISDFSGPPITYDVRGGKHRQSIFTDGMCLIGLDKYIVEPLPRNFKELTYHIPKNIFYFGLPPILNYLNTELN